MRLGRDTVAVERFSRTAGLLEGERLMRVPRTSLVRYAATLAPDGTIVRFESSSLAGTGDSAPESSSTVVFGMDSVRVTLTAGDSSRTYSVNPTAPATVFLPLSFALYEQLVRQMIGGGADSAGAELVFPGVFNPLPTSVWRTAPDSAVLDFFGAPLLLRVDRAGRILGADASGTTQKVTVTRVRGADIAALALSFAARDSAEGPPGQLSPRDTVRATLGAAEIVIDYGRPRMRGRRIMGSVVPWNEVWRTGANAATGFTTSADLVLGGVEVPAGTYTLYSLPRPEGAELIVSRQTGQWGTEYDRDLDLARIPLVQRTLEMPVEALTIDIEMGEEPVLRITWERTEWTSTIMPR